LDKQQDWAAESDAGAEKQGGGLLFTIFFSLLFFSPFSRTYNGVCFCQVKSSVHQYI
jgi:hypothetical protein